jgi:DNA polymerase-3 subunit delta'
LSRCQLIKIPLLEDEEVEAALQERENADAGTARQIAGVAGGNYREALQQLQHADEDWHNLLRDWLNAILKAGPIAQVKWVDKVSGLGREKQKQFLRYFNHMLAQAVHLRVMPDDDRIPDQERDFALRLNKIADLGQQQAIIEELDRASYFIERNANAKMLFHALTIKLYHIIQDKIVFLTE